VKQENSPFSVFSTSVLPSPVSRSPFFIFPVSLLLSPIFLSPVCSLSAFVDPVGSENRTGASLPAQLNLLLHLFNRGLRPKWVKVPREACPPSLSLRPALLPCRARRTGESGGRVGIFYFVRKLKMQTK